MSPGDALALRGGHLTFGIFRRADLTKHTKPKELQGRREWASDTNTIPRCTDVVGVIGEIPYCTAKPHIIRLALKDHLPSDNLVSILPVSRIAMVKIGFSIVGGR